MKSAVITLLLIVAFALHPRVLRAGEPKQVAYEPAVVALSGTIVEEGYGDDAAPVDRGKRAWILRLDQPISVPAKPGDKIDTEEKNVREVHLNPGELKRPLPKVAFGKTRFVATGTLYHAHTVHHLRPIVMMVSTLRGAKQVDSPELDDAHKRRYSKETRLRGYSSVGRASRSQRSFALLRLSGTEMDRPSPVWSLKESELRSLDTSSWTLADRSRPNFQPQGGKTGGPPTQVRLKVLPLK